MGYIKKLKSNELVGGTDKTTIYPVTSTEAVFEEITEGSESSFKSQKTINKEQQDELDDHEERIQAAEAKDIKSITINGSTKKFEVDSKNNVDLTIYTVDSDPDMPDIADNVRDLRNMVGTSTPVLETSHKTRIETLEATVGTGGTIDSRIATTRAELQEQINTKQIQLHVGSGLTLDNNGNLSATLDPAMSKVVTAWPSQASAVKGLIYLKPTSTAGVYEQRVYNDSSYTTLDNVTLSISTDDTLNTGSANPLKNSTVAAQIGYFDHTGNNDNDGSSKVKNITATGFTLPTTAGGAIKIKMKEPNTYAGTQADPVQLQFNNVTSTKKTLLYNHELVSATNTWERDEVISVYYDGTYYQASNAQGGGGKAYKIKYDNSVSGLAANNVQGALDEVKEEIVFDIVPVTISLSKSVSGVWITGNKWTSKTDIAPISAFMPASLLNNASIIEITGIANTQIAFLTSDSCVVGEDPDYCEGTERVITIGATTVKLNVPSDCAYIYFVKSYGGTNRMPSNISAIVSVKSKIESIGTDIDEIRETNTIYKEIDIATLNEINCYLYKSNKVWKWQNNYTTAGGNWGKFVPVESGRTYKLLSGTQVATCAFLTNNQHATGNANNFASDTVPFTISANSDKIVTIPRDASYLYFNTRGEAIDYSLSNLYKYEYINDLVIDVDSITENFDSYKKSNYIFGEQQRWIGGKYYNNGSVYIGSQWTEATKSSSDWTCVKAAVSEGDIVKFTADARNAGGYNLCYMVVNNDGIVIAMSAAERFLENYMYIIPENAAYIYVNSRVTAEYNLRVTISPQNAYDKLSEDINSEITDFNNVYIGKKVIPRRNTFSCTKFGEGIFKDAYNGKSAQGCAVFGNYMFRFHDYGYCLIYNIEDVNAVKYLGAYKFTDSESNTHCNAAQFAPVVENGYDFPLCYVSYNREECGVDVVRVSLEGVELVQKIRVNSQETPNMIIGDDGYLWTGAVKSGVFTTYKFSCPNISEGDVTLELSNAIETWNVNVPAISTWQGMMVYCNKIYFLYGTASVRRCFIVIDTITHNYETLVDINDITSGEPEDLEIWKDKIIIAFNSNYCYLLDFR